MIEKNELQNEDVFTINQLSHLIGLKLEEMEGNDILNVYHEFYPDDDMKYLGDTLFSRKKVETKTRPIEMVRIFDSDHTWETIMVDIPADTLCTCIEAVGRQVAAETSGYSESLFMLYNSHEDYRL